MKLGGWVGDERAGVDRMATEGKKGNEGELLWPEQSLRTWTPGLAKEVLLLNKVFLGYSPDVTVQTRELPGGQVALLHRSPKSRLYVLLLQSFPEVTAKITAHLAHFVGILDLKISRHHFSVMQPSHLKKWCFASFIPLSLYCLSHLKLSQENTTGWVA